MSPRFTGDGVETCEPQLEQPTSTEAELEDTAFKFDVIDYYEETGYPSYNPFTTERTESWRNQLVTTPAPAAAEDGQYICRRESDCHVNASCEYDVASRKYKCKCKKWYEGDGWSQCKPGTQYTAPYFFNNELMIVSI